MSALKTASSILSSSAVGAGIGAGAGGLLGHLMAPTETRSYPAGMSGMGTNTYKDQNSSYPVGGALLGLLLGGGLGAAQGLGARLSDSRYRRQKLEDDRTKRDEALADDLVKRQRGLDETWATKYLLPREAEQKGLIAPKAVKTAAIAKLLRLLS